MNRLLYILVGLLLGVFIVTLVEEENSTKLVAEGNEQKEIAQVKEEDEICPIEIDATFEGATVSFLHVAIDSSSYVQGEAVGKEFDPVTFSEGLYDPMTGKDTDHKSYPWTTEEIHLNGIDESETVYYGLTAMNHTPHIAYVVKDAKVIFQSEGGANINIDSTMNGLIVSETLDWNVGKYKKTMYKEVDGVFLPQWYQISCKVAGPN